ncbi:MAG: hypothetical protein R2684_01515 [Pyrinomonadaceae bacterium]
MDEGIKTEDFKLACTIIDTLLESNEAVGDLLVVMAHALDEDVLKGLTNTGEWEKYLDVKRKLENVSDDVSRLTEVLRRFE